MIAIVVGVTILFQTLPVTDEKDAQDKHIAKLDAALDNAEMTKNRLAREVEAIKLDPEYAGMIARDRLNLMREGETILRIDHVGPKK